MRVNEYNSGIIEVESKGGKTASVAGGHVSVSAKGGGGGVLLSALEDGGHVHILGLQANMMGGYPSQVSMGVEEHGGYVSTFRTDGKRAAEMGATVHGG
ncbi:MAG: hypothetical protein OXT74_15435 [Candidatus Poribacteria bacterium]|nr:hypothetical protein [Candidatus Poribacteria bacterium]